MLALAAGPDAIDAGMTTGTGFQFGVRGEDNLPRLMHRMARQATLNRLLGVVPLVANEAGGDIAVALAMAIDTGHHGMLARELLKLCRRSGMTGGAVLSQTIGEGHADRPMGIGVTGQTFRLRGTVRQGVTAFALGHNFVPIVAIGVVGMKNDMTLDAIKLMTATLVLERLKVGGVTLTALGGGHLFDWGVVGISARGGARNGDGGRFKGHNGRRLGRGRWRRLRLGNRLDAGNRQHHQSHDRQQRHGSATLFLLSLHENLSFTSRHLKCAHGAHIENNQTATGVCGWLFDPDRNYLLFRSWAML